MNIDPANQGPHNQTAAFTVVVNHEEQYSLWPAHRELPPGWSKVGRPGSREECLAAIDQLWTEMRPKSLRGPRERSGDAILASPRPADPTRDGTPAPEFDLSLVERLSAAPQPVEAVMDREPTLAALEECIDIGYVHVKFTNTRGGTVLGMRLVKRPPRSPAANRKGGSSLIHLEGGLTLDQIPVRCEVDLDPTTLRGQGRLVPRIDLPKETP